MQNKYNDEPVIYCSLCLSLAIRNIDGTDYCDKCGSTHTEENSILVWEKLYKVKYGVKFL